MSKVTTLNQQLTIAQELAIQSQLNSRMYGVLESLMSDMEDKSDWKYFSLKLLNEFLYLQKYGSLTVSIKIGIEGDHVTNGKQLNLVRQMNKKLSKALRNLSDQIDTYSDPGFFSSWAEAVCLGCDSPPQPFIAALQVA